jgi:hypothetical protein
LSGSSGVCITSIVGSWEHFLSYRYNIKNPVTFKRIGLFAAGLQLGESGVGQQPPFQAMQSAHFAKLLGCFIDQS